MTQLAVKTVGGFVDNHFHVEGNCALGTECEVVNGVVPPAVLRRRSECSRTSIALHDASELRTSVAIRYRSGEEIRRH